MKLLIELSEDRYNSIMRKAKYRRVTGMDFVIAKGVPLDTDLDLTEVQAYFAGMTYGCEQGRKALIEDVKAKIEAKEMVETNIERQFYNMALDDVVKILDSVGKEE